MVVSVVLIFVLRGLTLLFEVIDSSKGGSDVITDLVHLVGEVLVLLGGEVLEGLSEGGHLSNENKHVLGEVLGELSHLASILRSLAVGLDIIVSLEEFALLDILENLGSLGEEVEVVLEVFEVEELPGVGDDLVELNHVSDGLVVEALLHLIRHVSLVEGLVESVIESLDSVNVPHDVVFGLVGLGGSEESSNSEELSSFHF